jgi:transcription initiation factor IIE alpha subunit
MKKEKRTMAINEALRKAFETGIYICPECGGQMEFENDLQLTLICTVCNHDMDYDHYGLTDEEYEDLYPSYEDVCGTEDEEPDEDYTGETYDEVYDELSRD